MPQFVAADTGGTFTDVSIYDAGNGEFRFGKTLTTYENLVDGVIAAVREANGSITDTSWLRHGTTHIINAFLQRRGARTALITTRGFRDVLEIGRGNRPAPFDTKRRREAPLVQRALRFEVTERIGPDGKIIEPLDEEEVRALVSTLRSLSVEAVAISFLNAYANPDHEQRVADILKIMLPGIYITMGTSLTREWFEFERTSTAAANAFVGPTIARYMEGFSDFLTRKNFKGSLSMMGSNGGIMPFDAAIERPIALVESGPIGGVIATAEYARSLKLPRVVAFDMGGTTAKCGLVENGRFEIQPTYWVGGYERGFPIRTAVLDVVEVGAGGSSIAWVDAQRRLRVGPKSAGSEPGPACFACGGEEPTVTDANLLLGRIGDGSFLGGRLKLDKEAADIALRRKVAIPLGYGENDDAATRVAHGILDLATTMMADAIKEITVARGHDVRTFALVVFGGGGPIFGAELARRLGIHRVVVPPEPGNFSAIGMLIAQARRDMARSFVSDLSVDGLAEIERVKRELADVAMTAARNEFGEQSVTLKWHADMRYRGQRHTVSVAFEGEPRAEALAETFEAAYAKRFGRTLGQDFVPEIVGLRVTAEGAAAHLSLGSLARVALHGSKPIAYKTRPLHNRATGWVDAPVWRRQDMPVGFQLRGPAIIEEYSSTLLVGPDDLAEIGKLGEITISVSQDRGNLS